MSEAKYLGELAYELRLRRLPEAEVAAAVDSVRATRCPSDQTLSGVLGTPKDYAERFPEGRAWSPGFKVAMIMVITAAIVAGVRAAWSLVLQMPPNPWVSTAIYSFAISWAVAGVIVGFRIDHRVPSAP